MRENRYFWTSIVFLSIILVLSGVIFLLSSYFARTSASEATVTSEILRDFGILLSSIGIVSILYETLIRRQLLTDYNQMIREIVNPDAQKLGVFALFRDRHDKASSGRLPTNIIALVRQDFLAVGLGLYQFVPEQQDLIKTRLHEGCNFRFLIFDVNSPHIGALEKSLGHGTGTLTGFIQNCTDFFKKFQEEIERLAPKGKLDVRVYDAVPPWGLIAIDHERPNGRILIEFNGIQVEGSACPGAEIIPKEGGWYRFFSEQIALIWTAGKPLAILKLQQHDGGT